jgi:hypothetical protein
MTSSPNWLIWTLSAFENWVRMPEADSAVEAWV